MDAESIILNATRQYLRLKGWKVIRHQQGMGCEPGIPDLSAIKHGKTIYLECKSPKWKGKLSIDQLKWQVDCESHGGTFLVIDDVTKMMQIVDDIEHTIKLKERLP